MNPRNPPDYHIIIILYINQKKKLVINIISYCNYSVVYTLVGKYILYNK